MAVGRDLCVVRNALALPELPMTSFVAVVEFWLYWNYEFRCWVVLNDAIGVPLPSDRLFGVDAGRPLA